MNLRCTLSGGIGQEFGSLTQRAYCVASITRSHDPTAWTFSALSRVQMKIKGVPGKTFLLDYYGGARYGGVSTVLKMRGFWALNTEGVNPAVDRQYYATSSFNCSYWGLPEMTHHLRKRYPYGASSAGILNEMLVYHVDQILGFNTVPPGKLIGIDARTYVMWFSEWLCAKDRDLQRHLEAMEAAHKQPGKREKLVIVGWLQQKIDPLAPSTPMRIFDCLIEEPNGTNVGGGPHFLQSYYEARLTMTIACRIDVRSNCFATQYGADTPAWCDVPLDQRGRNGIRALNLDNDRVCRHNMGTPTWHRPCAVPPAVRSSAISRLENFSDRLLGAIRKREPLVTGPDIDYIKEYLRYAEPYVRNLVAQFQACDSSRRQTVHQDGS